MDEKLQKEYEKWQIERLKNVLEKYPERKSEFYTDSNIEIDRVSLPFDFDYCEELGFPGSYPYTRGIQPTMYRGKFWTMRQYAGFGNAEETNRRFHYLLNSGQTGLSVAFDLPTQMGYDSDHPIAEGEVGKVGVSIDSLEDIEILFNKISLKKISTSMTINATAGILLAMYIALAKKQGADLKKISGTIQNDVLKEYIARGTYIYPPKPSLKIIADIFEYCSNNLPNWNTISISGYHIREAGSNAVQEVAFTLANAIEYVKTAVERGLDINVFGSRLSFFFNAHNNFFEEIAKFRAARRIWAKIMKEKFKATKDNCYKLRFHTQTAGSTLTAQQPRNNIIRVTLQALAAVLGGTQSLHTNSWDEALSLPAEESAMIALRTQQSLAYESGITDTVDPLGGSYFIEKLTKEIEEMVYGYLDKIEKLGGALKGIETGYFQKEISETSYEYQKAVEENEKIIVGLNKFSFDEEVEIKTLKISSEIRNRQIRKLKALRKRRDNKNVKNSLEELKEAAENNKNVMPPIISCVERYATLGEISDVLRTVYGEYRSV